MILAMQLLFTAGLICAGGVIFFLACLGLWHLNVFNRPTIVKTPALPPSPSLPPVPKYRSDSYSGISPDFRFGMDRSRSEKLH